MGQKQSKEKLLYKQVSSGNVERIRALRQEGADLEWMDKEGKTPLILACTKAELYDVAQALIELGANVNAYHRGISFEFCNVIQLNVLVFLLLSVSTPYAAAFTYHAQTPLYHAATRGLENTVKLLLSNGANFDCQTPLQLARYNGLTKVVREIESHICLFSGWMREFYGPAILDFFAPQLLSRSVWVVIVPTTGSCHPKPYKFKLAMYTSLQDAQPRMVMALRNQNVEEPKSMHPDTSVLIYDDTTKKSLKLAPSIREGRQQLKWFCDAFKGIQQPTHQPVFLQTVLPSAPPLTDDDTAAEEEGQTHYPLSDSTPGDVPSASVEGENTDDVSSRRQCVICMDDPSDAVCVPCGHLAGCMSCLTEVKSKKWGCPVCRAEIDQIMKVYCV